MVASKNVDVYRICVRFILDMFGLVNCRNNLDILGTYYLL